MGLRRLSSHLLFALVVQVLITVDPILANSCPQVFKVALTPQSDLDQMLISMTGRADSIDVFRAAGATNPHALIGSLLQAHTAQGLEAKTQPIDFINSTNPQRQEMGRVLVEIYRLHDTADTNAKSYFLALGRNMGIGRAPVREQGNLIFPQPDANVSGEVWDMASGIYSIEYFSELSPQRTFRLFDYSFFVTGYLQGYASNQGHHHIQPEQRSILDLPIPTQGLAEIRTKNAIGYVPQFGRALNEITSWVAPGGQIVLQSDRPPFGFATGFNNLLAGHQDMIIRLLSEGWSMSYEFNGRYSFDTIILKRPIGLAQTVSLETADSQIDLLVQEHRRIHGSNAIRPNR